MTHIVRNSCDHGIESPEDRKKTGKSDVGHICIRAYHEGGQVLVDIQDDGKGLNKEKLIAKALEKGIISQERIAQMTERDIYNLIFAPGFSTAAQVTNVSGRGVGMDVVKNNIEKIGGQVELLSQLGKGMTVRLKIPLTLAIVPAMIIRTGEARYAIPQVKLVELVRVESGTSQEQIEFLQGKPMYRLRGNLLPLVNLQEVLGLCNENQERANTITNIVVLNAEGQMFGLIVDEIQDTADIVVKPLSQFLKALALYSGATVLGDGSVALILDVTGLANNVHLMAKGKVSASMAVGASDAREYSSDSQEFLLFKVNAIGKYSIPLNLVHRLEEFNSDQIEYSGNQKVIRYRGSILPIVSLNNFLKFPETAKEAKSTVSVIVVKKSEKLFGVEVNDILDVTSIDANVDDSLKDRPGILGNIIMGNEVVVIVDILEVLSGESARMSKKDTSPNASSSGDRSITDYDERRSKHPIFFAEDTAFFRKHVAKVLQSAGYPVVLATDGKDAFEKLDSGNTGDISLVLSDIEMPKMNGLELARALRKIDKWKQTPMIALTTKYSERSVKEGKEAGFNEYMEKMNAEQLLKQIDSYLLK